MLFLGGVTSDASECVRESWFRDNVSWQVNSVHGLRTNVKRRGPLPHAFVFSSPVITCNHENIAATQRRTATGDALAFATNANRRAAGGSIRCYQLDVQKLQLNVISSKSNTKAECGGTRPGNPLAPYADAAGIVT